MGKQADSNSRNNNEPDDDYELKVLIDKCNVCHSNLDTDHHKLCTHHGERRSAAAKRNFVVVLTNFAILQTLPPNTSIGACTGVT